MSRLIETVDEMIDRDSLLKHPFYKTWSDGALSMDSLAGYSREYFQLVKAVPDLISPIIKEAPEDVMSELETNQNEERDHVEHWIRFAGSLGVDEKDLQSYTGLEETQRAVSDLYGAVSSYEEGACAMYALEKEIPKISKTKLEGLAEFYGIDDKDAIEYFRLHMEADIRHAASWRRIIKDCDMDHELLINAAARSISAQNLLLDGCYEAYCTAV